MRTPRPGIHPLRSIGPAKLFQLANSPEAPCFDMLAHSWVRQESQLPSPQSLPNTWSQNARVAYPSRRSALRPTGGQLRRRILSSSLPVPTHEKPARLTPSFSTAALHFFLLFHSCRNKS